MPSPDEALRQAVSDNNVAAVEAALAGGANLTPLMNVALGGHVGVARLLLDRGARVDRGLLSSLQMKVGILEENAEAGMVLPSAAEAWRGFLEYLVGKWKEQNQG